MPSSPIELASSLSSKEQNQQISLYRLTTLNTNQSNPQHCITQSSSFVMEHLHYRQISLVRHVCIIDKKTKGKQDRADEREEVLRNAPER
jgi:hypothetical protein